MTSDNTAIHHNRYFGNGFKFKPHSFSKNIKMPLKYQKYIPIREKRENGKTQPETNLNNCKLAG